MTEVNAIIIGKGYSAYRGYTLEELREAGVKIWLFNDDPVDKTTPVDHYFKVDFNIDPNIEAERIKQKNDAWPNFVGICYIENLLPWASIFLKCLKVPFISPEKAELLRSKSGQRQCFRRAGIPTPHYKVGKPERIKQMNLTYPLIVKPENGYSSIGVELIESRDELFEYFSRDNNVNFNRYIVEDIIQGYEYSIEGYVKNETIVPFAKTIKFKTSPPYFEEIGQYCSRKILLNDSERALFSQVVTALEINNSILHLEYFDSQGKLTPVEVGGRLGGDKIPYIQRRANGKSLLLEYLNIRHNFKMSSDVGIGIIFFVPSESGKVISTFPSKKLIAELGEHFIETKAHAEIQVAPEEFFVRLGFKVLNAGSIDEFVQRGNEFISLFERESGIKLHRLQF